jgi:glycosyltransferase involved in cell wall biosynthesis
VVSGVNLVEGGTLAVFQQFLRAAREELGPGWTVIALVHRAFETSIPGVQEMAFPGVKASWLRRLWFEYWQCQRLSKQLKADLWVAMHDITPRVHARRQAVYCHNPAPFFHVTRREARLDPKLWFFRHLYGAMYRINIRRNHAVIVQQQWLRGEFQRRYQPREVIVARPVSSDDAGQPQVGRYRRGTVFLFPALARPFKNFELICQAVRLLEQQEGWQGEVRLTVDGTENDYARELVDQFGDCRSLRFLGLLSSDAMKVQYAQAHCLIFPSRRETWGLPLTEAKAHGMAILAADLPYAHESVGNYDAASFFDVDDAQALAQRMCAFQKGTLTFETPSFVTPEAPFARNWAELVRWLTEGL